MFWVDAKMLIDYAQFDDVISFDTTFGTNRELRPLVVFVGFNLLEKSGIWRALMYDEV
jgi:hypothetical protein